MNSSYKKTILLTVFVMIAIIIVGTYAWLSYRTNETAMVLTIGEIENVRVTLSPYQINKKMASVTSYTSGAVTDVTAVNNSNKNQHVQLYYQINQIDSALAISSFKYVITKSTNGGSSYTSYSTGNFTSASSNSIKNILDESIPGNGTTYMYKVYLFLDGSTGNNSSAAGKVFNGELRADINSQSSYMNVSTTLLTSINSKAATVTQDGVYYFDSNGNLDYGTSSNKINLNLTGDIPKGNVSIWNKKVIYSCFNYGDLNYEYDLKTKKVNVRDMPCAIERHQNLVVNGDLSYSSNYNLTAFGTYLDGYLTRTSNTSATLMSTDFIPIDPNKTYVIGMDLKSSNTTATYYIGFSSYDVSKNSIDQYQVGYVNNTLTYLTQDLTSTDTVIHVNSLANWNVSTTAAYRGIIVWNYSDETGYLYPSSTYSRNVYSGLYSDAATAVDKTNNLISLSSAWGKATLPAGTYISQRNSTTGTYNYNVLSNKKVTTDWVTYSANVTGTGRTNNTFRSGTKYIKLMVLDNNNKTSGTTSYFKNIYIREI